MGHFYACLLVLGRFIPQAPEGTFVCLKQRPRQSDPLPGVLCYIKFQREP